jgi:hypothetical protein
MFEIRIICSGFAVILLGGCSVTEQTPADVGQKFQEGVHGNGKLVPANSDNPQNPATNNSPVTVPAGAPPS